MGVTMSGMDVYIPVANIVDYHRIKPEFLDWMADRVGSRRDQWLLFINDPKFQTATIFLIVVDDIIATEIRMRWG